MRVNTAELNRLAGQITAALLRQEQVRVKVSRAELAAKIEALLVDNIRAEEALESEAEKLALRHSREMIGMDQRMVIEGIKARLAKERGFVL